MRITYVLRVWNDTSHERQADLRTLRCSLENPITGEVLRFLTLEEAISYIRARAGDFIVARTS